MRGLGRGLGKKLKKGPGYSSAARDYFARVAAAGGTLTAAEKKTLIDNWFINSDSYRDKILRLNCWPCDGFAGAEIPLVNTFGATADTLNNFVSGDYSESIGLTGDASTKFIATGLAPVAAGANNATFGEFVILTGAFSFASYQTFMACFSADLSSRADVFIENQASPNEKISAYIGRGAAGYSNALVPEALVGIYGGQGQAGGTQFYKDGVPSGSPVASAAWIQAPGNLFVFCRDQNGTKGQFIAAKMGGYVTTVGMSDAEILSMHDDLLALMQGLGRLP